MQNAEGVGSPFFISWETAAIQKAAMCKGINDIRNNFNGEGNNKYGRTDKNLFVSYVKHVILMIIYGITNKM